jgi:hypothetical protein
MKTSFPINNLRFVFYFLFFPGILLTTGVFGQKVLEDSIMNGNNFQKAAFRLWFENETKIIQGVIVLVPGSNGDGRMMVEDTAWQHLAVRHDFALLGCWFEDAYHENMDIEAYADAKSGSGQALLDILQAFSAKSAHPELGTAPLALWGISAGGEFNYEFVCWKPERVIVFVVNKGGIYYSLLAPPATWEVPGIFFVGELDSPYRNNVVEGIFCINRRFGAKWLLLEEPGTYHEFERSDEFARFYFDNIIPLRISGESTNASADLNILSFPGYIGINSKRKIMEESENYPPGITSWFPNRPIAEKWLDFTK